MTDTDQAGADSAGKPGDDAGILVTWRSAPLAVKALLAGIVVNRLGAFIQIFLVLFLTTRGFSTVQAGAALAAYSAGGTLGVFVGGSLTDWFGARRTIMISMIGGAGLTLAILYMPHYPTLVTVVFLVGLIGGGYRPAADTLIADLTPEHRRVMIFAMDRLAYNLGNAAAPLVGAALIAVSYTFLFWAEAAAALAYAAIAAVALPRHTRTRTRRSASEDTSEPDGPTERGGYLAVLADRRFRLFLIAALINTVVYVQYISTLPVAMREAGLSTGWYGGVIALNGVIVITCELLMTKVTQRWPMRVVVLVGFALLGGGMSIYALPFGVAVFVAGTLVWSLAEIIAGPTMFAYPTMAGPPRLRSRYISSTIAMFGVGSASGSIIGLAVWTQLGTAVWPLCGLVCLFGMAAAWTGMRPAPAGGPAADADTEGDLDDRPQPATG